MRNNRKVNVHFWFHMNTSFLSESPGILWPPHSFFSLVLLIIWCNVHKYYSSNHVTCSDQTQKRWHSVYPWFAEMYTANIVSGHVVLSSKIQSTFRLDFGLTLSSLFIFLPSVSSLFPFTITHLLSLNKALTACCLWNLELWNLGKKCLPSIFFTPLFIYLILSL